jgi:hypothetical protein
MDMRNAGIGLCVAGLMAATVSAQGSHSSKATGQTTDPSALTLVGCVERDNGNSPAGPAGSGGSTAASATAGSNAAAYRLDKLDPTVLSQAATAMGKTGGRSAGNMADAGQTAASAVPNSSMNLADAKDFVLRPSTGKVRLGSFVGKRVQVKGQLINAADAMAGPTSAGGTTPPGSTGTVATSNLGALGIDVTTITDLGVKCGK